MWAWNCSFNKSSGALHTCPFFDALSVLRYPILIYNAFKSSTLEISHPRGSECFTGGSQQLLDRNYDSQAILIHNTGRMFQKPDKVLGTALRSAKSPQTWRSLSQVYLYQMFHSLNSSCPHQSTTQHSQSLYISPKRFTAVHRISMLCIPLIIANKKLEHSLANSFFWRLMLQNVLLMTYFPIQTYILPTYQCAVLLTTVAPGRLLWKQ